MPKLSIIVPIYNTEKYLNDCVNSILSQTFEDFELILINDGSTDSSAFLCDTLLQRDKRIKVIHKENEGQGIARNCGINAANGEFIAFIDSDDFIENTMYARLTAECSNYDAVFCCIKRVLAENKIVEIKDVLNCKLLNSNDIKTELIYPLIGVLSAKETPILASACRAIYKTEIVKSNNIFFESERQYLSEDLLFNIKFLAQCKSVKCINEALYCYRDNQNSFSTSYNEDRFNKINRLHKRASELCSELGFPSKEYQQRLSTTILGHISVCVKQIVANENTIGKIKVKNLIKEISEDNNVKVLLKTSKYFNLQFPLSLFCFLIDKKYYSILILLIKIFLK